MQVKEIMAKDVACCTPSTQLRDVAQMMVDCDCGAIPVVESNDSRRPVGVVTDRDICCRAVAKGKNPLEMNASDVMSKNVKTVKPDTDLEECCNVMEHEQIRRIFVVDKDGACCGVVAQADIALHGPEHEVAETVRDVSKAAQSAR